MTESSPTYRSFREVGLANGVTLERITSYEALEGELQTGFVPAFMWAQAVGDSKPTRAQQINAGFTPNAAMSWLDYDCFVVQGLEELE